MDKRLRVLQMISCERTRQEDLRGKKFMNSCADPLLGNQTKLAILGEEFGEVCKCITEMNEPILVGKANRPTEEDLKTELLHVAAVAVAWLEAYQEQS